MKQHRSLFAGALLVAATAALSACGGEIPSTTANNAAPTVASVATTAAKAIPTVVASAPTVAAQAAPTMVAAATAVSAVATTFAPTVNAAISGAAPTAASAATIVAQQTGIKVSGATITGLQSMANSVIQAGVALQMGDMAKAQAAFKNVDTTWASISPDIQKNAPAAYAGLNDAVKQIDTVMTSTGTDPKMASTALQQFATTLTQAIASMVAM